MGIKMGWGLDGGPPWGRGVGKQLDRGSECGTGLGRGEWGTMWVQRRASKETMVHLYVQPRIIQHQLYTECGAYGSEHR